ncbi:hypothetical protein ACSQ67_025255 [Phaseolus vulgaris]
MVRRNSSLYNSWFVVFVARFIHTLVLPSRFLASMPTFGALLLYLCRFKRSACQAPWPSPYLDAFGEEPPSCLEAIGERFRFNILRYYELSKVCFEFCVANDKGEVYGSIYKCGVGLINVLEVHNVLQELAIGVNQALLIHLLKYGSNKEAPVNGILRVVYTQMPF